jgi:16S rRNA (guanine(966)-N(2))-methyltransferase RsmD
MRISSGSLKGRRIPFDNHKFDDADVTPSKVKEAVFSMLGEDLTGKTFLDLFAGSGQVGLEALSRGAAWTVFNDRDGKRVHFIGELARQWGLVDRSLVLHMSSAQCLRFLEHREKSFDIVFLDPPYIKKGDDKYFYADILASLAKHRLLADNAAVIIQHFSKNSIPEEAGGLALQKTRTYGTSSLSVYGAPGSPGEGIIP